MSGSTGLAALILRLSMGVLFIAHGFYLKLFIFGIDGTIGYFESLGLPGDFAYATIAGETLAGLGLIFGVLTRLAALSMIPVLAGSIMFAHGDNGWLFSNEGGGWEFPAFWIVGCVLQVLLGSGPYTLRVPFLNNLEK